MSRNYLGTQGYTIYKSDYSAEMIKKIKKDLKITPVSQMGGRMGGNSFQVSYVTYRESENKLYLPRFYGIKSLSIPSSSKLHIGMDIELPFEGELRPIQQTIVNAYIQSVEKQSLDCGFLGGGGLLELECGGGKTVCGLNIISLLKKKTLIIVQKEFLVNQWMERIQQFLPTARVGKIQASTIDIDNKDIVIGMLQSLSMKTYPDELFHSFGLTIIDEVHHISSEVFSKALFKIVTPYMLGLSATMERKDGTTYVFKMFLGEIVYKTVNTETRDVEVRSIQYYNDDPNFNSVKTDYKGNVLYSTLISKLCEYIPRSDFIIQIVKDILEKNPKRQIMCIAHNRNVLEYFYNEIIRQDIATVGKYLGGMKQDKLKETETKQIVIATYSMASEALDIKTLNCLVMITPKTDIVQSVGRILREKHEFPALVIDIVDCHRPLVNQFNKRKSYYKKENYTVQYLGWGKTKPIYLHVPSGKSKKKSKKIVCDIFEMDEIEQFLLDTTPPMKCLVPINDD
jgi:superfamily II DNA or RNA helicase